MGAATDRPSWAPDEVDLALPSAARVYDYYLGGSHNFAVDREMARKVLAVMPNAPQAAAENRGFLRRAVAHVAGLGVTQFLDIGSGIPTVGNTHEVVGQINPDARVVYADIDPVAVIHSEAILAGNDNADVVRADVREPKALIEAVESTGLIDFAQPVAVMMVALLHFLSDADDPKAVIGQFRDIMAPGSYLIVSHGTFDGTDDLEKVAGIYARSPIPATMRDHASVLELFDGFTLLKPGLVFTPLWWVGEPAKQVTDPGAAGVYGGVGRKD